jgi:hypothetical protein
MIKFSRNMSSLDRSIRIIVGSILLLIGPLTNFIDTDMISNIILGVLGAIAVLSGVFAYCFLYDITGFNTRRE